MSEDGALVSIASGLRQLGEFIPQHYLVLLPYANSFRKGATVVPVSSLIVGARLYSCTTERAERHRMNFPTDSKNNENEFGIGLHALIFTMRLFIFPSIGRFLFSKLGLYKLPNLVGIFSLIEYSVPSANSSVSLNVPTLTCLVVATNLISLHRLWLS